jgi:plastocyanin
MGSMSSSPTYSSNATMTMGSTGTGATHTVIVAPTKGVLRYVPFAVNASVGDTVMFMWGAGPHTVTKSSVLDVCNKTDDQAFSSGQQNASFVFTQVVNDTNPTFYYCGVPGHCQKGMFGIINPPNAAAQPSSVANMLPGIAANTSAVSTSWASTKNYTGAASTWGGSMDLSGMPGWAQSAMAENVLFTRSVMAANPSAITANGDINLGQIDLANMMIPADVAALAAASAPASNSSSATSGTNPAAPSSTPSSSVNNAATTSGAGALASPRSAVALVAAAVMFFAL